MDFPITPDVYGSTIPLDKGRITSPRCIPSVKASEGEPMSKDVSNKRTPPFSIRLSVEERAELERRADSAGLTIGGYCKFVIFDVPPPRRSLAGRPSPAWT